MKRALLIALTSACILPTAVHAQEPTAEEEANAFVTCPAQGCVRLSADDLRMEPVSIGAALHVGEPSPSSEVSNEGATQEQRGRIIIGPHVRRLPVPDYSTPVLSNVRLVLPVNRIIIVDRIEQYDEQLNAVIVHNPDTFLEQQANANLPFRGRTVLVKDNIETSEWPTTAGSIALARNRTNRDAPLITNLRVAGGVVLGKTNLSEWANIRSNNSSSGWSAVGGQTRNPHATDRTPCGSSSGSAAAVAAGFSWAAIGTETDGSITCPASVNGVVGFKPTVGMVSRTYVVPISHSQDTAGPLANSVSDAALLLGAMAGSDPLDPATAEADSRMTDFTQGLEAASLAGVRLGVMRGQIGGNAQVAAVFEQALRDLEAAGAVLVDIEYTPEESMWDDEYTVLLYELREGLDAYLQGSPADIPVRSLDDVIAFNIANADTEMRWFGQDIFELAAQTTDRDAYLAARANSFNLAGPQGIDRLLAEHDVSFLIAPTVGPAWPIDLVLGDHYTPGIGAGGLAAIAGYPHLTVPMGDVENLPVGLSFLGGKWADHEVLKAGSAYERARSVILPQPSMRPWSPSER